MAPCPGSGMTVCTEPLPKDFVPIMMARLWSCKAPATISDAEAEPLLMSTKVDETNPNSVPIEKQIWKESDAQSTPAEVVNSNMYDEAALNRLDEESRKQYAQDFVENARKGGFHVVLSKDLTKIESVTPIRKPSQQEDSVESFPSN